MTTERSQRRRLLRWDRPREMVKGRWVAVGDIAHGSYSTYANCHCRCIPCTESHREHLKEQRRLRRLRLVEKDGRPFHPDVKKHGASAYSNWGCRCAWCTEAFTEQRTWYLRTRKERERAKKTG